MSGGCISVATEFSNDGVVEVEEDCIDLGDMLSKYDYDVNKVFDSIAMFPKEGTAGDLQMLCISLARPNNRTLIRLEDAEVLESNMSNAMIERLVCDVKKIKK